MQWLAALCVRRPVFATVLILSLTVVGAFSFTRLGVDRFPKIDFPTVVVTTVQPGAAPEQIETEITDKIEEAVNTISGIDELRSTSSEGVSLVIDRVPARQGHRRRRAGSARQDQQRAAAPAEDDRAAARREVRSRRRAGAERRASRRSKPVREVTEYADKVLRRQLESVSRASARCSSSAAASGRSTSGSTPTGCARYNLTVTDVAARAAGPEHRSAGRPRRSGRGSP